MACVEGELTCRELVELVTGYLEEALPPGERARFEAHLEGCPSCAIHLDQLRFTLAAVRASADLGTHPGLPALLDAFRSWKLPA